jgi:hypothetical protein
MLPICICRVARKFAKGAVLVRVLDGGCNSETKLLSALRAIHVSARAEEDFRGLHYRF